MHNKDLIILAIFSIVSLLLLYRRFNKGKNSTTIFPIKKDNIEQYVRHNPVPIFDSVMNINEKYYETIPMKQKKTINVVLCYADWCGNCHKVLPIFNLLKDINSLPNVKYLTVEENDKGYSKYQNLIKYYPTVLVDVDNDITQYTGSLSKSAIINYVNNI